jgi:integrase
LKIPVSAVRFCPWAPFSVLFKRKNSKRWQARIRRHSGEWLVYSTKQADFEAAAAVAEERYRDIQYAQRTGKIDVTKRFSSLCKVCRKELLAKADSTGLELPKNLVQVIDRYIDPILGSYMCHNIDGEVLRMYSVKRAEMIGHVPSESTVATHNTALNYLFRKAKALNFIEFIPKTINDGTKSRRRPYFASDELRLLNANMWRYLQHSEKLLGKKGRIGIETIAEKTFWIREMLRDVVLILVNTGMRPGRELLDLKWKHLSVVEQDGAESIRFSLPHSKTIRRVVIGYEPRVDAETGIRYGCWEPLRRIQSRFDDLKGLSWPQLFNVDEYIFRYPNGERVVQEQMTKAFKQLLKWIDNSGREDGLLNDDFGDARTLYSLRHTYASRRRYEGMSFDDLSVQMGTSVQMLEKHYSHFTVSDNPNRFSGHEKREQQQRDQQQDASAQQLQSLVEQNAEQSKRIADLLEQNNALMRKIIDKK